MKLFAPGIRDVSVTLGARVAAIVPGLAIQSCLAWFLEPSGRGSYAVCMMFAAILSVAFLFGFDAAAQYFIASKRFSVSQGVTVWMVLGGLGGLLAVVVGLLVIRLPIESFRKAPELALTLAVVLAAVQLWSTSLLLLLTAVRAFTYCAIINIVQSILRLGGTVLAIKVMGWGVGGAVAANIAAAGFVIILALIYFRRKFDLHWVRPTWERLRYMAGYGARYYLASISNMMNAQIGVLVLFLFASESKIGLFAAGVALVMNVLMIADAVAGVILPRVASDAAGRPELTAMCARVVTALCGGCVLLIAVFAEPIVSVLLSDRFLPAVPIIRIVAIGAVLRSTAKIIVPYLNGTNHPGVFSIATLCSTVTNLVLLLVLLPRMGLVGAAWAMTAGSFVGTAILVYSFRRFSGLTLLQTWRPRTEDFAFLLEMWHGFRSKTAPR